jgi:hypothetical protein
MQHISQKVYITCCESAQSGPFVLCFHLVLSFYEFYIFIVWFCFENPLFLTPLDVFFKFVLKVIGCACFSFILKRLMPSSTFSWLGCFPLEVFFCVCAFHIKLMTLFYLKVFYHFWQMIYLGRFHPYCFSQVKAIIFDQRFFSTQTWRAPNYLRNPNVGPKAKQWKKKKVGACFLAFSTLKVGRHVRASMRLRWTQKWEFKMRSTYTT